MKDAKNWHRIGRWAFACALATLPGSVPAQDAARVQPRSFRVAFENKEVRVLEYTALPGMGVCGTGVHSHPRHVSVLLTPARVRVQKDGKIFTVENKAGDVFWEPAGRHEAENISGKAVKSLIIELKGPEVR